MPDYIAIRERVAASIRRAGQAGVLRRPGVPGGDEWDQTPDTPAVPTNFQVLIAPFAAEMVAWLGAQIEGSKDSVLMAALAQDGSVAEAPRLSDQIVYRDGAHEVTNVQTIDPGGIAVLYIVDVTR